MALNFGKLRFQLLKWNFKDLKKYQSLIEESLKNEANEIARDFNNLDFPLNVEGDGNEEESRYYQFLIEDYSERHAQMTKQFPHTFRASLFIQNISFIEVSLIDICEDCTYFKNEKFELRSKRGNSRFEDIEAYLIKEANVNFSNLTKEWDEIKCCYLLRNKFVHDRGNINTDEQNMDRKERSLYIFTQKNSSLNLEESKSDEGYNKSVLINSRELVDDLMNNAEIFFEKLLLNEIVYIKKQMN